MGDLLGIGTPGWRRTQELSMLMVENGRDGYSPGIGLLGLRTTLELSMPRLGHGRDG